MSKKEVNICFAVSFEERVLIRAHAEREGVSISSHCRKILLEAERQDKIKHGCADLKGPA